MKEEIRDEEAEAELEQAKLRLAQIKAHRKSTVAKRKKIEQESNKRPPRRRLGT